MLFSACDLHLHSTASAANDEWYSREFGCPESYAAPRRQYALCKARGMTLVTLTDHDTIAGGLELLDRSDFFLSEEVSAIFPEDGCAVHILAWNITPAQHDKLQAARPSIYDVVEVLRRERIAHACAHPMFSPNSKLSVAALEKIVVLFPVLEGINGLSPHQLGSDLRHLAAGLDDTVLDRLALHHGIQRGGCGRPRLVAGSDAHTERHSASCFTSVPAEVGAAGFFDEIQRGRAETHGEGAELDVMAMTASRVTYGFLQSRKLEDPSYRDPFLDLVDVLSGAERGTAPPTGLRDELVRSMVTGAARAAVRPGSHLDLDSPADVMTEFRRVHDALIGEACDALGEGVRNLDMYKLLGALRDGAAAVATALPFLFAADHFARQRQHANTVSDAWTASPRPPARARLAIFSDSIDHVDGVTSSLRRFVANAALDGREVRIPYCGPAPANAREGVYLPLAAVRSQRTNIYADLELHVPSPLATIDWLWRNNITHVELATPGPMGIVGLLAARLLRLPVTASYHTEVLGLLGQLSSNALLHKGATTLARWFYNAVDQVFAFSEASRQRLLELGVPAARIEQLAVAIDPEEFSPVHAHPEVFRSFGVAATHGRIVLTVGRLSREKNVKLIIEAIGQLQESARPPVLVVVGEGPDRAALEQYAADKPYVVFVGLQQGETLRRLYASASAFVFASRIDTLGLATMEAMASGVPVIVPADAAIAEIVVHGNTGYCYEFGVEGLVASLASIDESPEHRARLSQNARKAMVDRWGQARFADMWRAITNEAVRDS